MAVVTMNVSLSEQQAEMINREVRAGRYASASEYVRELIREREQKQTAEDISTLEKAHAGAWERDTNSEEEAIILQAKREARAERRK